MEEIFYRQLPKIELHAHLNGSLSRNTLIKLGCLKEETVQYQPTNTNMQQCFELFKVAHNATNNTKSLHLATKSVIEEFAEENVVYLELRTTPRKEKEMSEEQYIQTIIDAIQLHEEHNIIVKLLPSLDRRRSFEQQLKTLDLIIKFKQLYPQIIKGIDLSGNPAEGSFHEPLFQEARRNGLSIAIHCGEIKNDEEVEKMLNFKPDRIGHATFIHPNYGGSEKIWDIYTQLQIPTEICLTSNIICGTSKSYKDHHVQEWIKESWPFCLNTDDKGVFNTTLSKEFSLASSHYSLSKQQMWEISLQSVDYSFASAEEKLYLKEKLKRWSEIHLPTN